MFIKGESKNKFLKVDYNDILYIEGLKNYVSVFTPAQRIVTYQTLRDLETTLPKPPFYRVHKSYIISVDKIRMVDGNTVYIGDQSIPIGETYRDSFLKMIRDAE
jgi:DNA-binding LytR/AlgR family response regulator